MTTMNKEELMEIGFNRNEAVVYLSLIKFGEADAHQLIQDTKFHKNIVYDNLNKLMEKGLLSYILKDGKKIFSIASPNMLVEFFDEEEKHIRTKKEKAVKLSEEISLAVKTVKHKQEAGIYRGLKGIKSFFKETLEGKDYAVFGAPKASVEIMGETFWRMSYDSIRKVLYMTLTLIGLGGGLDYIDRQATKDVPKQLLTNI